MPLPMVSDEPVSSHKKQMPAADHIDTEQARIKQKLVSIKKKIGVHSGKGGVGKTFVACNIAAILAAEGYEVGLLDADIDCPNVHAFFNLKRDLLIDDTGFLEPVRAHSIKIVSTGFMQPEDEALIIRGPIKHRVLTDFLEKTAWGPLDYLIMDFPPGTSDVPLSAMQMADLSGIILVTTPQKEAVTDVKRAAGMARTLKVPIIGLIENMSGDVFGSVGEKLAQELHVPFIGSIPLAKSIHDTNESGEIALLAPELEAFTRELLDKIVYDKTA